MFQQRFQCDFGGNNWVKYARITITHVCFIALALAGSLGRCLNTRHIDFVKLFGTRQMLMHEKTCVISIIGPQREKTCLREFANNTGADQPALPRSLISAFVIHALELTISKLATSEISTFSLVSVAEETVLKLALSETPKTSFLATGPILYVGLLSDIHVVVCVSFLALNNR